MQGSRTDEIYAAAICFTLAVLGIITNGVAFAVLLTTKNLQNAFGYSCMSHAIGDLGVLIIFATWVPIQLILTPDVMPNFLQDKRLSYTIGQATILFYYASIYTHVLIGLNRYIAIAKPFSYGIYFNAEKTVKWIMLIWFISFAQSCIYQFDGCHFYFDRNLLLFIYSNAPCAEILSVYCEFYVNLLFVIFVVLLDILTFWKLKTMPKSTQRTETRKRKSQEIRYFIQSVCSETALILTFICFWCIAIHATTAFSMFLLNLGAWETLHAADGFIMIAFNNQICNCVKKTAKQATVPAVTLALSVASRKSNFSSLKHGDRWLQLFEQNKLQTNKGILSRRHE